MASVDVTRIAGNIGALNALNSLQSINAQLSLHQTRLSTGKQIVDAADDPAGLSLATSFDVKRSGLKTILSSIGDAKNLLSTAEGGMRKIQDILVKMKNKALEGQTSTIGTTEKKAIAAQLNAFASEIDSIVDQTQWNGTNLIGSSGSAGGASGTNAASSNFTFLTSIGNENATTHATTNTTSTFQIQSGQGYGAYATGTNGLGLQGTATAVGGIQAFTETDVASTTSGALDKISAALAKVKDGISDVGAFSARLTFKEEQLTVAYTNTEAAYNRIMNANMAEEQVEASKLTILQQTGTAMLAQANTAPQFLLALFR
jgi:flagellin